MRKAGIVRALHWSFEIAIRRNRTKVNFGYTIKTIVSGNIRLVILSHPRDFEIHSEPLLGLRHAFENLYGLWHGLLLALPSLQEVFSLESGRRRDN